MNISWQTRPVTRCINSGRWSQDQAEFVDVSSEATERASPVHYISKCIDQQRSTKRMKRMQKSGQIDAKPCQRVISAMVIAFKVDPLNTLKKMQISHFHVERR